MCSCILIFLCIKSGNSEEWYSIAVYTFVTNKIHRPVGTSLHDETILSYRFSQFLVIDTKSPDFDIYKASSLTQRKPCFQIGVACRCLPVLQMVSYPVTHPVCVKWELTKTRVTFNRPSSRSKDCRWGSLIGLNKFGRTTCEQCACMCVCVRSVF